MAEQAGLFGGVFARGGVDTSDGAWLRAMLGTEAALARSLERAGLAPPGAGSAVTAAASGGAIGLTAIAGQDARAGNPVPALVRALTAHVPTSVAGAVHYGATSQDIIDTAAMVLAREAFGVIERDLYAAAGAAARLAAAHRHSLMIGRTLLQQAVPVTFGLVAAGWLTGLDQARAGVARVAAQRLAVQFGGAAGTLASLGADGPRVARLLAGELGLGVPVMPWHTDRTRIIEIAAACAAAAAALGKIARDVTLLTQPEIGEVAESGETSAAHEALEDSGAGVRRGGSSAMPHKRNPVAAIAILGCARRAPGLLATLAAAAEQEHQRAAGAWHSEWGPFGDLLRLTGSASAWGGDLLAGLTPDPARMRKNLDAARGLPLAESVARLLARSLGPVAAHDLVARASAHALATGAELRESLALDDVRQRLDQAGITTAQIEQALDPASYLGATQHFIDAALTAHAAGPPPTPG